MTLTATRSSSSLFASSCISIRPTLFAPTRPSFPIQTYKLAMATHSRKVSTASARGTGPAANIKHGHHHIPQRHHVPSPSDFDTSNAIEARKYLKTYGLTPPGVDTFEKQEQRCLALLAARKTPIEKYQYLSVLRNTNVHLFYRLLAGNVKVRVWR